MEEFHLCILSSPLVSFSSLPDDDESIKQLPEAFLQCFKPIFTRGDGNCFWRGVLICILGNDEHHAQLRHLVYSEILHHEHDYRHFLDVSFSEDSYESLLTSVGTDGVYAKNTEIYATSRILQRPIHIYTDFHKRPATVASLFEYMLDVRNGVHQRILFDDRYADAPPINLHWRGPNINSIKDHFVALMPLSTQNPPTNMDQYVNLRQFGRIG